jgi:hypothetical protein
LLELTERVFSAERSNTSIRGTAYTVLKVIGDISGPSMSKADVVEQGQLIAACCKDLLPDTNIAERDQSSKATRIEGNKGFDLNGSSKTSTLPTQTPELTDAATGLLTTLATKINPAAMPRKIRVQIERTAILTRNKDAWVACVLNPAAKHAGGKLETSLLPILAREFPDEMEVEALLRPRMVPVTQRKSDDGYDDVDPFDGQEGDDVDDGGTDAETRNVMDLDRTQRLIWSGNETMPTTEPRNQEGEGEEDDLYSLTPPRNPPVGFEAPAIAGTSTNAPLYGLNGMKRFADAELSATELPSKRTRMSPPVALRPLGDMEPSAEPLQSQLIEQTAVREAKQNGPQTGMQNPSEDLHMDEAVAETGNGASGAKTVQHNDIGSDASDFELPPLTMESDTDPDDEDEDVDGDEA